MQIKLELQSVRGILAAHWVSKISCSIDSENLEIVFQLSKKEVNGDSLVPPRGHNHFVTSTDYHKVGQIYNTLLSTNGCEQMLVSDLVLPILFNKLDLLCMR